LLHFALYSSLFHQAVAKATYEVHDNVICNHSKNMSVTKRLKSQDETMSSPYLRYKTFIQALNSFDNLFVKPHVTIR